MASGDPVVQFLEIMPLETTYATRTIRAGGSTPGEIIQTWDFDDTTPEYLDIKIGLAGYDATTGLTFRLEWFGNTQTTGTVQWEAAIQRGDDGGNDFDVAHTYAFNTTSVTTSITAGALDYATITFTDGADMDSLAEGEVGILRIRRNPAGTDTLTGDANLFTIRGEET